MAELPTKAWVARLILLLIVILCLGCAGQDVDGGLRLGIATDIGGLDPLASNSSHSAVTLVFDTLIRKDGNAYRPALATAWQADAGQLVWTFTLRSAVTFSDGTVLDAHSVKFSLDRYCWLRQGKGGLADVIAKTEVLGPTTVRITLNRPYAPLLDDLCRHSLSVISPDCVEPPHNIQGVWARVIGSGPFVLMSNKPRQHAEFSRNDVYWGEKARTAKLLLRIIPDEESRALALEGGQIDMIYANWDGHGATLTYRRAQSLAQKGYNVITGDSSINKLLVFNTVTGPLRHDAVRSYLYEVVRGKTSELVTGLLAPGEGKIATGLFAAGIDWPEGSLPAPRRVAKPEQMPTKLRFLVCSSEPHDLAVAQLIQAYLAEENISLFIQQADRASFWEFVDKKEYDLTLLATMGVPYDPWGMLTWGFAGESAAIYYTPELARQIELLQHTTQQQRAEVQTNINKLLSASYAFVPLYQEINFAVVRPEVIPFTLLPGQAVLLPWEKMGIKE
ncbi:hypothetical protein KL86SPO_70102 [uncultured Sporomusa sp.]|uniref:Solute-binding protein family 5 domain-containing protein n=2 Tax=uncultured Sporomusa sp. TaxID=307249 RepID=A0A212M073_9FIRM|nr:hypothetical protein KL86SPO_70102 [uncultured Sporomusa sp.]